MPRKVGNGLYIDGAITIPAGAGAGKVLTSDGAGLATWTPVASKTFRTSHTWAIFGVITDSMPIPEFYVPIVAGQVASVVSVRAKINSGTSVDCQLNKNGVPVGSAVSVTTTAATTARSTTLADGDALDLVTSSATGSPSDLSFSVILEHVV